MSKLFALAVVASLFVASTAQAASHGSCCAPAAACCSQAEPSCASGSPAAAADEHSNMNMPSAKAPQSTRSFSYQPSTGYSAPRTMSRPGWNSGVRGAASKALGNY